VVGATLVQSLVWFGINATTEPNIRRFQSLWDPRVLSQMGNYTHALRLFRYYDSQNDSLGMIDVWQRYSRIYPNDPRGYENQIIALTAFKPTDYSRRSDVYEHWVAIDSSNDSLRSEYAGFCIDAGNALFTTNKFDDAKTFYQKAITENPTSARAYNNLGSVFAQEGKLDTAITLFTKAIQLDEKYSDAYYNLGTAYTDKGQRTQGLPFIRKSADLGNSRAKQFLDQNGSK
jgi:tetratricopeptide (TPR) repeat protein